jgi:hypothetical protein
MLVSLPMMMLPYRVEYPLAVLVWAAMISIAEDRWSRARFPVSFTAAFRYITAAIKTDAKFLKETSGNPVA